MHIIKVNLVKRSYDIIIGSGIIKSLGSYIYKLNIGNNAYVITNRSIKNRYGKILNKTLKEAGFNTKLKLIPDSEESKSFKVVSVLTKDIAAYDKKRRIFIVAFGGGVIGDLAGFVASIYKRGIDYIQVPTTLLAQVDSSIGGKTGIDLNAGKNLVGTFYQPHLVFSDTEFLKTLSLKQLKTGLAEVIKYAIIKDMQLFEYLEKQFKDILNLKEGPALEFIVKRCSYIKAKIVQEDEREEKGIRTILNFGHTIGHAIEAAGSYKIYNHGESISLGMLVASDLSMRLGLMNNKILKRIESLINIIGLPTRIKSIALDNVIKAYYRDKKFFGETNRFVLLKGIGKTKIVENIPLSLIREILNKRFYF